MRKNFTLLLILLSANCLAQESWKQQASQANNHRYGAFFFSIGNKGFMGTGADDVGPYKSDFWEYDPHYNVWTQKADFGGGIRAYGTGFSIGDKGYAGTGIVASYSWTKDMWANDTAANTWTIVDSFPGGLRYHLASFSIGDTGYVGTGEYRESPAVLSTYFNDFWAFNPAASPGQQWSRRADVPQEGRTAARGMRIGNKGYIGFGVYYYDTRKNDLWEFDPSMNTWTRKADLPAEGRYQPALFSIGDTGYVVGGQYYSALKDVWAFDPNASPLGTWTRKNDFPGEGRSFGTGMSIGNKGYVGFGTNGAIPLNDWWQYRTYPVTLSCRPDTTVPAAAGCASVVNGLDPIYSPADENPLVTYQIIYNGSMISSGLGSVSGKTFGLGTSYVYYQLPNWDQQCSFTVTVVDDPPVLTCPEPASYYKNDSNIYSIAPLIATDPCGIAQTAYSITGTTTRNGMGTNASGVFNLGTSTITWTVTDANNQTSICSTTVTILVETMPTITICSQTWMQKNLNVTKYRNGDPIPQVTDPLVWNSLTTGAWCYYNNDPATEAIYGKLYNWYAVNDPRGLAPVGWHIPNNGEWVALENCAADYFHAAGPLKEAGTLHWADPNAGATNATGFTALPGGQRSPGGGFSFLRSVGNWWSRDWGQYTHYGVTFAGGYYRSMFHASETFFGNPAFYSFPSFPIAEYKSGMSVRCVQDIPPVFTSCPSNQTVYSTVDSCGRVVGYTATATGNPAPSLSYTFTGATIASGSGTGSGQLFQPGVTTVTINASAENDTATCVFTVTVSDTIRPVITCPPAQNLCHQPSGNYTIPALVASDNCGIQSISYAITGATVRSGNSANASGLLNPGVNIIRWRVTDNAGNVAVCSTTVRVNNRLTVTIPDTYALLLWGNKNTLYRGFGPTCAPLIAITSGGTPFPGINAYRYSWSNGGTAITTLACPPMNAGSYTFKVTVTDAAGCSATASKTITVVDARCGPKNNEVSICWFGVSQSCLKPWQAALALYYGVGAKLGPCSQYSAAEMEQSQSPVDKESVDSKSKITIYPNPSTNNFNVNIQGGGKQQVHIRIYDAVGRGIGQLKGPSDKVYTFGEQYKPGIYWIDVQIGMEKTTLKVVKL